jgi:hypothetical protein
MTDKIYPGDSIARTFTFKDSTDTLFNPDTIAVLIIDPLGATLDTQAISDLVYVSLGTYRMLYTLAADAAVGNWNIKVTATYIADDLVNEESFPFTVYASPTIPYAVVDVVKTILQIPDADGSKYDNEIADCLLDSTAFVESLLAQKGLTPPTPTPRVINTVINYFAAWMFRKRRDPASSWIFYVDAERFLNAYCDSEVYNATSGTASELPIAIMQDDS